jgi:4-amino-4-deoxy-L-arabinose transferase-like glycosyltransferase
MDGTQPSPTPPSTQPHTLTAMPLIPRRPRSTLLSILVLWAIFYASFTLFTPPLLDDADSVHAEVAREMLLRHDYVTLYANGIRYLEKAPLLYWSIAASFKLFGVSTAAARIPLALTILALALATESFARRAFSNPRAGLYAALILLSSPGIFLFTRITLPDAMVCLWLTLALYAFYLTEQLDRTLQLTTNDGVPHPSQPHRDGWDVRLLCYLFATTCALNVLTKGLIGIVFPTAIVLIYLLLTRGLSQTITRIRQLHPFTSLLVFLAVAAPWHILIALANPTQAHPGNLTFTNGHFAVPLPTNGNVHGWLWFYFINEQLLRYLNLRVPRDYDTVPLYLFWGLILIWLMPFSAFIFKALSYARAVTRNLWPAIFDSDLNKKLHGRHLSSLLAAPNRSLLLTLGAAIPLLFFSLSTRQEYYVLPALPSLAILIAGWLAQDSRTTWQPVTQAAKKIRQANLRITAGLLSLGTLFAIAATIFLLYTHTPSPNTDLAQLLQQNPSDYALSMGHFLDLNAQALGLFRLPLALAAAGLFLSPLASFVLRKREKPHAATLTLAAGAFTFLLAAHLALQTFAPVLTSQQLAAAIAPQLHADDLIVIHQEYEFASTLGFYLKRNDLHILEGRSSNLWYGSFFPDAPAIFETPEILAQRWPKPQRIFLWQDLANQPSPLPPLPGPIYVIAESGGKEILSNQPNRP